MRIKLNYMKDTKKKKMFLILLFIRSERNTIFVLFDVYQ